MMKKTIVAIVAGLLVGGVALAATNLSYTNTFTLSPGEYCYTHSETLIGNQFKVVTKVVDGACTSGGETITVAAPTPTPTPSVSTPSQCPDIEYNVVAVPSNASEVRGTSGADLIITGSGYEVEGRGGDDCIVTGSGSKVEGNGGDDNITTGTGSIVKGGTGTDTCVVGSGSSKQSCEL